MDDVVNVIMPLDAEAALALESPGRREAAGRYLSSLLKGGGARDVLAEVIVAAKQEARENGLTDDDVESELEVWRAERGS